TAAAGHPPTLPVPLTPLIGRDREVAAVADLARQGARLRTLTGTGGAGKTRLAIQIAADLAASARAGVVYVPLASIRDPALVPEALARVLGVRETPGHPILSGVSNALRDRQTLLVLDNFEQVIDSAPVVSELLGSCPQLSVLVTSREPLRIQGEQEFQVTPLAIPDLTQAVATADLARVPAVALLLQRARAVQHDFTLTPQNARVIADLCVRLDGLPLAIELAAARLSTLTPATLLARLSHRLQVLTGGRRDAPERQRTLRNTIAWSYDLLSSQEQALFRRLSVFAGGFTLAAAEAVADPDTARDADVLDGLTALVEKSLIIRREQPAGEPRYAMLETIREFGLEQVSERQETDSLAQLHLAWVLELVERAAEGLYGQDQRDWLARLDAEIDNAHAALAAARNLEEGEALLRVAVALRHYWLTRGLLSEGQRWVTSGLALAGNAPPSLRADAWTMLGGFAYSFHDYSLAVESLDRAVALHTETGNSAGLAWALSTQAWTAIYQGEYVDAAALFEQAVSLARSSDDRHRLATVLAGQSIAVACAMDYARATSIAEESLALYRAVGVQTGVAQILGYLGYFALWQGHIEQAQEWADACHSLSGELDSIKLAFAQELLGYVQVERGNYAEAGVQFRAALEREGRDPYAMTIAECLEGLAAAAAGLGDLNRGATLLGAAEAVRAQFRTPVPPPRQERYDRTLARVRAGSDADALAGAWARGRALPLSEAISYGLEPDTAFSGDPATTRSTRDATVALSPRELDVLRLVATGLTDTQVAERLFLSRRTVSSHLTSIYAKLSVPSRAAAATYALHHKLIELPPS
ncbi:MAG TPA: LuxR C-terminal-related transcriptional regulator, partial [Thermomicrobiales bacterium]|nr:LuxR C-terminal-related transcriptional regulator [Thermomicrobiales bacterium]